MPYNEVCPVSSYMNRDILIISGILRHLQASKEMSRLSKKLTTGILMCDTEMLYGALRPPSKVSTN